MTGTMAKRPRVTFDTSERFRRAFMLWAASRGLTPNKGFDKAVEEYMAKYLVLADEQLAAEAKQTKPPKAK